MSLLLCSGQFFHCIQLKVGIPSILISYLFISVCLFETQSIMEGDKEMKRIIPYRSSALKSIHQSETDKAEANGTKLHLGVPLGWQRPKYWNLHLLTSRYLSKKLDWKLSGFKPRYFHRGCRLPKSQLNLLLWNTHRCASYV